MGGSTVNVYSFTREDAKWVAHRGIHEYYKENTANAFRAAANMYEIWGIECDIWETMHVRPEVELPKKPADYENVAGQSVEDNNDMVVTAAEDDNLDEHSVNDTNIDEEPEVLATSTQEDSVQDPKSEAVAGEIQGLEIGSMTDNEILDNSETIKASKEKYDKLTPAQKYEVRSILGDDTLKEFLDAAADIAEYESYDLVVNHDRDFKDVFGVKINVWDITNDQIKTHPVLGNKVCFLSDFMQICKNSGKVPVVEIKGEWNSSSDYHMLSDEGARKTVETIVDVGGVSLLKQTKFISFHAASLDRIKNYVSTKYKFQPYTIYLINKDGSSKIQLAAEHHYNAVAVTLSMMNDSFYNLAKYTYGLGVGTWTYRNTSSGRKALKNHVLSGKYDLEYATIDYDIFH